MTALTVVVATRNRPVLVADCLRSLQAQSLAGFEIVVVDDGSDVDIRAAVEAVTGPVPVRYLHQGHAGLSVARNHGTAEARADLVAYLDDDALADPGWAAALLDATEELGADAVAGRTDLLVETEPPPWLTPGMRALLGETHLGDERRLLAPHEVAFGGNCAVTRDAFERVGGFATRLGRTGTSLRSNEDVLLSRRLTRMGARIVYEPRARMRHRVAAERLTTAFLRSRARAQGVSDVLLACELGTDVTGSRRTVTEARFAVRTVPILIKGCLRRGTGGITGAVVWTEYCRGRRAARRTAVRGASPGGDG